MPIVYVHGIAVRREGEDGWDNVKPFVNRVAWPHIQQQLRTYIAPVLNPAAPAQVVIEQAYWGNLGAQPHFPPPLAESPPPSALPPAELAEQLERHVRRELPIEAWPELIEAVWVTAHDSGLRQQWLGQTPDEQWRTLRRATEAEVRRRWHAEHPLNVWPFMQQLRQVFRADLLQRVIQLRGPLEGFLPYFMGDLLGYLATRGTPQQPGIIPALVMQKLRQANDIRRETGEPVVVLTHSMGGQLMYDALSAFAPAQADLQDLRVDLWCAAASQLALFTSLDLFVNDTSADGTLPVPASVGYLWNVWSPTDLLSFQGEPSLRGAQDAALTLTSDPLEAHMQYVMQPAFYRALASKLKVVLLAERT